MELSDEDKIDIIDSALVLRQWKNTKDPFVIAKAMGVNIIYSDVTPYVMEGYSYCGETTKEIRINSNFDIKRQTMICAHELGHLVLSHTGKSYYKDIDIIREHCANLFAVSLLYLYNGFKYKSDLMELTNYALHTILENSCIS